MNLSEICLHHFTCFYIQECTMFLAVSICQLKEELLHATEEAAKAKVKEQLADRLSDAEAHHAALTYYKQVVKYFWFTWVINLCLYGSCLECYFDGH